MHEFDHRYIKFLFFIIFPLCWLPGCPGEAGLIPARFSCVIISSYPHDAAAFTQGLAWDEGSVYEGTGLHGRSSLRLVNLRTGEIEKRIDYGNRIFAEGITIFEDKIYQLTWHNNIVFAYDKKNFSLVSTWRFPGEGWGITHDNRNLIVSDGSATLYFLDPETMAEKRRITVLDHSGPIHHLNELEYIKNRIYANIWESDEIAIIHPDSGRVEGWIDLSGLRDRLPDEHGQPNVLNGIMYAPEEDRLFVTGKLWPLLFEIKLIPATDGGN
ncbi:MAG: glutaminyl-peptide cyclotransferase [Desulfobulbaceae bacterium]|nr:glutaminyl-peptide cyclotransferase [Desulfobulbaceae bacterium]